MYVSPISALFPGGKSTPAKRAIYLLLSLSLFVFRVDANDAHHTFAADHLAFVANFLYRRSYLHKTPGWALASPTSWLSCNQSFRVILPRVDGAGPFFPHQSRHLPAPAYGLVSPHGPFSVTAMQCSK